MITSSRKPNEEAVHRRARHAYTSFVATGTKKGAQRNMDDWHDFFLAAAGAAAVLAGLVFVGLSINLDTIMSNPTYGLPGRALEALVLLVSVLVVTILLLMPAQGMVLAGVEMLAVGIADWVAIVAIHLLQLKNWQSLAPNLRWNFVWRVGLGQAATLPFVAAGVAVLSRGVGGLYLLVAGVVLSFLVAVAEAWVLLVEIHR
jgi:modulator of FtsH protease